MSGELSMDQVLLNKLNDVLEVNMSNELFGVRELAEEMSISRAQLHRKIIKITGKSSSQYIREFRLEKAMEMLQDNVATASEIAYRVGFKSPTYFNTSFHNYFGYPPGEAKHRNPIPKDDKVIIQTNEQNLDDQDKSLVSKIEKISFRQRMIFLFSLGLLLIISFSYYFYFNTNDIIKEKANETGIKDRSIAIIPFKNLSDEKQDEYFTKGVMVSVQNHLNKINGLKVIPEKSMEKYADTSMATSEIAKEVGVSYLLDGTVQKYGDSIRIIIHFISAKDDQQLSSMIFDEQFKNIFGIQNNIAKQVAEDLNITLSPTEIEQIEKKPTQNLEAYNFYLQANFQKNKGTNNGLKNAIKLYDKAIQLDSTFIEAYVEKADSWMLAGAVWGLCKEDEAWIKAKHILQNAQNLDSTNKRIKRKILGGLYIYEWDFKIMENEYKNSDIAGAYTIQTGRYSESLTSANEWIQKNPTEAFAYVGKAQALFFLNRKKEATELLKKYDELFNDNINYLREASKYYLYMDEYEKSKELLNKLMINFPDRSPIVLWLNTVHAELDGNSEAVNNYLGKLKGKYDEEESGSPAWFLALYYCIVNDYETAFKWLQKSYDRHEVEMIWLREEPLLKPLRNDHRYLELYKKVGFPMQPHSFEVLSRKKT